MDLEITSLDILVKNRQVLSASENEFNVLLYQTNDLQVLYEFFKLKLAFIKNDVQSTINFPVDHILLQINKDNIDEVCRVLKLGFLIQSDDSQYEGFLKFIRDKNLLNEESFDYLLHQENLVHLNLLKFAVGLCDSKTKNLAFKQNFGDFLLKLLFCESRFVRDFVIVHVFPPYLQNGGKDSKILEVILGNALSNENLSVLCGLWDSFLDKERLFESGAFWSLIQKCLLNQDELKNALFLMKQSIILIQDRDSFGSTSDVIHWNLETKTDVTTALTNFLILFDVSQEKQLYLIEPSYHLLTKIEILDPSWLLCLYKIFLSHSLTSVRMHCLQLLLKSTWCNNWFLTEISRYIFNSLNIYTLVKTKEVWDALSIFFGNLNDQQFLVLLGESLNTQWVPSVSYKFYKTYFATKRQIFIPVNILKVLKVNIENIPHIHIRDACMQEIKSFVRNSLTLYREFDVFIKMNFTLYGNEYSPKDDEDLIDFSTYQSDIEAVTKKWCSHSEPIPIETEIIFKLLTLPLFHSHLITLCNSFALNAINPALSARVCFLLCQQGMKIDVLNFINSELSKPSTNYNEIRNLLPFLTPNSARSFYEMYSTIIRDFPSTAEIAFEIISLYVDLSGNEEAFLIESWKNLFIASAMPFTTNMCSLYLNFVYSKISKYFQFSPHPFQLFPVLENILEKCHDEALPIIATNLGILMHNHLYGHPFTEEMDDYINSLLRAIKDSNRGDCFKSAIKNFIISFYRFVRITDDFTLGKILGVTWNLFTISCDFDHVAANLSSCLSDFLLKNTDHVAPFLPVVVELLLRGNNLGNVQRAEYMVCQEIDDLENNPNLVKLSVRVNMIRTIDSLINDHTTSIKYVAFLVDEMTLLLMKKYKAHFKKRYSENCEVHLQKLRILQALLTMYQHIEIQKDDLVQLLMDSLCQENHQPSIKFFIQWLLIKLLNDEDENESFSLIASKLNSASKVHKSTIIAFAPILYHLVSNKDEKFWIDAIKIMLPWTMGPHFNLRLYSQETLSRLFDRAETKGFENLLQNFHPMVDSINIVLNKSERRLDAIDDFVYYSFKPDDHFHLGVIYYDVPKFTRVTQEEYENIFNIEWFKSYRHGRCSFIFPNVQQNVVLPQEEVLCDLVQKKLQVLKDKGESFGELIVLASLVDKIPNLGGLCRSCEVFQVKKLILRNKSCLLDPQFRNVSLSSENWTDIAEVKVEALPKFLLDMKENQGYAIVGAEQTSNSIKLNKFLFPKKSVLVLGNEKEGIPPNLLPLLDFCVEIPQFGVVRSLNVHVAASTFIYEYTKQQLPDDN